MSTNFLHWGQAFCGRLGNSASLCSSLDELALQHASYLKTELSSGRLAFMSMPYRESLEQELPKVMAAFKGKFKHLLLLGIGGSALGARALQKAFRPQMDWPGYEGPHLWIADNVDAFSLSAWMDKLPPKDTMVVVISKSGGTIETMAQYFIVREWLQKHLGSGWKKNVLLITDASTGALRQEANGQGLASLPVPANLGGRFSVLSAVGMVPAYFCNMDWKALMAGAADVFSTLIDNPASFSTHPAWRLACWNKCLMDNGYSQLIFFSYIPTWACFGSWFAQLWGESLGKAGKGSMPLPAVGVTDQHSLQQMFLDGPKDKGCLFLESDNLSKGARFGDNVPEAWSYLRGKHFGDVLAAETVAALGAFAANKVPLVKMSLDSPSEYNAGKLIGLLELTTVFTGWLLEINPLDQPAVEYAKRLANARLGASGYVQEEKDLQNYFAMPNDSQEF